MEDTRGDLTVGFPPPLDAFDSIMLSLKRYWNLGQINDRYNSDFMRAAIVTELEKLSSGEIFDMNAKKRVEPRPVPGDMEYRYLNFPR
jgi:hypothetical protein